MGMMPAKMIHLDESERTRCRRNDIGHVTHLELLKHLAIPIISREQQSLLELRPSACSQRLWSAQGEMRSAHHLEWHPPSSARLTVLTVRLQLQVSRTQLDIVSLTAQRRDSHKLHRRSGSAGGILDTLGVDARLACVARDNRTCTSAQ